MVENTYKIELLGDIQVSTTFNVGDLSPCHEDDERHNEDLRENPLQGGEVDTEKTPILDLRFQARGINQVGSMLTLVKDIVLLG